MEQHRSENWNPMDSLDEEVSIYLKVMKTVAFKVKRSETIGNIKALYCEKEGTKANFRELYLNGDRLEDHKRVVDYGIQRGSTLHMILQDLVRIKLLVIIPSTQKCVSIEARTYFPIKMVKSLIEHTEGIQPDQYKLFYAGRMLEDDQLIGSLGMHSDLVLNLIYNPNDKLSVRVTTPARQTVNLEVKLLYSVSDVKAIVGGLIGIPVDGYSLVYKGMQLHDSKSLASYDIEEGSILGLSPLKFQIFFKTPRGGTTTLNVKRSDTIRDVKTKIFQKVGVSGTGRCLRVYFCGKLLGDDHDLAYYNIQKDANLQTYFGVDKGLN